MKRLVAICVLLLLAAGLAENALAQVFGGTGVVRFRLTNAGAVRLDKGVQQVGRATVIVSFDSTSVFDYNDDQNVRAGYSAKLISSPLADTVATTLTDGAYAGVYPDILVRVNVLAWKDDSFFLVQHVILNQTAAPIRGYAAMAVVPKPSNTYGFESIVYDDPSKVAYYYRTGEAPHIGFKVMGGDPFSFHCLDWDAYSTDPDNEVTTDEMRCYLTNTPGFDAGLPEAGINGAIMHLTAGSGEIAVGDSVTMTYAVLYGTTPAEVTAAGAAAQVRYESLFTSVEPVSSELPDRHALRQNYPNPFNPSTRVQFDLAAAGFVMIKVYDLLGREVATLVNQELNAGTYTVPFSGEGLPSGTYVASMQSGDYRATSKMLLMK